MDCCIDIGFGQRPDILFIFAETGCTAFDLYTARAVLCRKPYTTLHNSNKEK